MLIIVNLCPSTIVGIDMIAYVESITSVFVALVITIGIVIITIANILFSSTTFCCTSVVVIRSTVVLNRVAKSAFEAVNGCSIENCVTYGTGLCADTSSSCAGCMSMQLTFACPFITNRLGHKEERTFIGSKKLKCSCLTPHYAFIPAGFFRRRIIANKYDMSVSCRNGCRIVILIFYSRKLYPFGCTGITVECINCELCISCFPACIGIKIEYSIFGKSISLITPHIRTVIYLIISRKGEICGLIAAAVIENNVYVILVFGNVVTIKLCIFIDKLHLCSAPTIVFSSIPEIAINLRPIRTVIEVNRLCFITAGCALFIYEVMGSCRNFIIVVAVSARTSISSISLRATCRSSYGRFVTVLVFRRGGVVCFCRRNRFV